MKQKFLTAGLVFFLAPFMLFIAFMIVPFVILTVSMLGLFAGPSIAAKWFTSRQVRRT